MPTRSRIGSFVRTFGPDEVTAEAYWLMKEYRREIATRHDLGDGHHAYRWRIRYRLGRV